MSVKQVSERQEATGVRARATAAHWDLVTEGFKTLRGIPISTITSFMESNQAPPNVEAAPPPPIARLLGLVDATPPAAKALPAPKPPKPDTVDSCPACALYKELSVAMGYVRGVAEECGEDSAPPPKGYAGTYPLAREAAGRAASLADVVAQREPKVAQSALALGESLRGWKGSMERVATCAEGRKIAEVGATLHAQARRLVNVYKQEEAKRAKAA